MDRSRRGLKADEREEFLDARAALCSGDARQLEGVADVLGGGARVQKVRGLEHHADTATRGTQWLAGQGGQVVAVDDDVSLGGLLEGCQTPDESGLARAGSTDDAVDRAAVNVQVHPIECDDLAAVFHGVDLGHPGEVNHELLRYWAVWPAQSAYGGVVQARAACRYKTPYRG